MTHPALTRHAYTVGRIRLLRALPGRQARLRRPARLPRQLPPAAVQLEYFKAIRPVCLRARASIRDVEPELYRLLEQRRRELGRSDAATVRLDVHERERARRLIDEAARKLSDAIEPRELYDVARRFGERAGDHQRLQLDRQVQAAIGVPLASITPPVADHVETFARRNVELIRTVPERYFDRIRGDVADAFEKGAHVEALAGQIADRYDMAENDARRIARDQVGKLAAQVNQARQESLGVVSYVWRTMNDARVRDEHAEREGQEYDWDDPPEDGHPGEPIQCLPGDARVRLLDAHVMRAYRRRYRGELVELVTDASAGGEALRCTPNHPVLTSRGWIAAHLVNVGDHVFEAPTQLVDGPVEDPQRRDPTLEEAFRAAAALGITHRVAGAAARFHGDGAPDEEVDVVDLDGCLGLELDPACGQYFCEDLLALADEPGLGSGQAFRVLFASGRAANSVVRGACKLAALIGSHLPVSLDHRCTSIARLDAIANELAADGRARDAEAFRESLHALSTGVELRHHLARVLLGVWRRAVDSPARRDAPSAEELREVVSTGKAEAQRAGSLGDGRSPVQQAHRIVEKRVVESYEGHVFNLETSSGWYVAQNLIVHNCRCFAEPVLKPIIDELGGAGFAGDEDTGSDDDEDEGE